VPLSTTTTFQSLLPTGRVPPRRRQPILPPVRCVRHVPRRDQLDQFPNLPYIVILLQSKNEYAIQRGGSRLVTTRGFGVFRGCIRLRLRYTHYFQHEHLHTTTSPRSLHTASQRPGRPAPFGLVSLERPGTRHPIKRDCTHQSSQEASGSSSRTVLNVKH
jgi:hypothetical protein